jgi:hypothetical protein
MKLSLAPVCAIILLVGCAGQATSNFSDETSDASTSFSAPDDKLDGGVCDDGSSNVWRHASNSWILTAPKIHLIFWGNWWIANATGNSTFLAESQSWTVLGNDPAFYAPLQEYGTGVGQLSGIYLSYPDLPNGPVSDELVTQEILKEIQDGSLPAGDDQSIFVVVLPPDTQSQYDIKENFGGHHSHVSNFTYAIVENHTNLDFVISHEVYESATNPDTSNGWWGPGGETEVADLCEGVDAWSLDGYSITRVWSQAHCQCVPS